LRRNLTTLVEPRENKIMKTKDLLAECANKINEHCPDAPEV